MHFSEKIGIYLLVSTVCLLCGGIIGLILPLSESSDAILLSFIMIGIVIFIGAMMELFIIVQTTVDEILYKKHKFNFLGILHLGILTFYSVVYYSIYPLIGEVVYNDNLFFDIANAEILLVWNTFRPFYTTALIALIVLWMIGAVLKYWDESNTNTKN